MAKGDAGLQDLKQTEEGQHDALLAHLTWENLSLRVSNKTGGKNLLADSAGCALPGKLLAILGPTGCGKTSLLNALAGRLPRTVRLSGQIFLNGHSSKVSYGTAAYVTQEDILTGTLTVRETLLCVANLRLSAHWKQQEKHALVSDVLRSMGLTEASNTYVGNWFIQGLSGGQLRRLSLACELLVRPKLMFLDEVTSGLDAAAAFHIVRCLQKLARESCTILASIHQPSSETFQQFDQLCLLANGQTVYFGQATAAPRVFADADMPVPELTSSCDHFLHCINSDFQEGAANNIESLMKAYHASAEHREVCKIVEEFRHEDMQPYKSEQAGPGWLRQTAILTHRNLINNMRDLGIFWVRLVMYAMLCIFLGFTFFQLDHTWKAVYSRASLLFFVVAFLTFMAVSAFPAFIEDLKVFTKERLNGYYGSSQFAAANTLASVPFIAVITVVSTLCVYYLAALNTDSDRVIYFMLDLFLSLLVTEALFQALTPFLPHFLAGIALGAGIMGMFMIVCGFFQLASSLPRPVLRIPMHYISFHTWAFHGFMHNEFDDQNNWECPCAAQPGGCLTPCTYSGQDVLAFYDIPGFSKWLDLVIILAMIVFYRMLFVFSLKAREVLSKLGLSFSCF